MEPYASVRGLPRAVMTDVRTERGVAPGVGDAVVFTVVVYMLIAKVIHGFLGISLSHSVGGDVTTVAPVVRNGEGVAPCPVAVLGGPSGEASLFKCFSGVLNITVEGMVKVKGGGTSGGADKVVFFLFGFTGSR